MLQRHACVKRTHLSVGNSVNLSRADVKTIAAPNMSDANGGKRVMTINLNNAQDLFAVAPLARATSTGDASSASSTSAGVVPMITIHILPDVAQALLGSASVDRAKLVELLQQANGGNATSAPEPMSTNHAS